MSKKMTVASVVVAVVLVLTAFSWAEEMTKININTATVEELTQLKGVGEKLAAKIVDYRTQNGPFEMVEDIMKVPGIGQKVLDNNMDRMSVE